MAPVGACFLALGASCFARMLPAGLLLERLNWEAFLGNEFENVVRLGRSCNDRAIVT